MSIYNKTHRMKIRTKNIIMDANNFRNIDCKVIATMYDFNLVNLTFKLKYEYEIPQQMFGPDGTVTDTIYTYETLHDFKNQVIDRDSINMLMQTIGSDLNAGGNYIENILGAMHECFRIKVGLDGRFGLTPDDWEKI